MTPVERFAELLRTHDRIVFFGGAGVSTESKIPDFRGKDGLYRQKTDLPWSPEEMLSHHFYEEHPVEFYTLYKEREGMMLQAQPNRAHYALAELERMGKLSAVVTQNIDGLHQKAAAGTCWSCTVRCCGISVRSAAGTTGWRNFWRSARRSRTVRPAGAW